MKAAPSLGPAAPAAAAGSMAPASVRLRVRGAASREEVLEFRAASTAEAVRQAASRGLQVLAIETPVLQASAAATRAGRFPLLLFSQELLALLEAGLNLTEALAALQAKERQPAVQGVLAELLTALREGRALSDALGERPQHFPAVYVATVRASERTGDLPHALARYIAYQLQFEVIRKKLVSAAIYPLMLLAVGGFVTLFLLGYVVPRFSAVYESAGRDVPWMSALLLAFGQLIHRHWMVVLPALLAGLVLLGWALAAPERRAALLSQVLRLPWLARQSEVFRLARFYRAVSLLLAAGISLPRAMGMVQGLLSSAQQVRLAAARLAVEQGQSLSVALVAAGLASPIAESLLKVGERSGQMAEMLERAARFHDDEFARWIDWASKLLEPLLMTVIGVVIGTVVVLMYMPIFELAGSLQ
ncbi:type II secretion system F family protein [Eleftheria terrae]|uniref:type II secretion system F family protein n=1 Tax=Eleftheria terrae TaxID=1597781 RepID=UPI00263A731D|nr:type II secretion system F family protein [Eleftheria terrae]WKB55276.1 type II secretion system F family protein [Eleftheria terrae]